MMDHSFSSYHFNLAQIPTDQREREQHHSVQTGVSDTEGILQVNTSQPYNNPCSVGENWPTFRSPIMPESMITYRHPGYASDAWDATAQETYQPSLAQITHNLGHEYIYPTPFYSAPPSNAFSVIATTNTMDNQLSSSNVKSVDHEGLLDWQNELVKSLYPTHVSFHYHPTKMEISDTKSLAKHTTPPSPLNSVSSRQSASRSPNSMSPAASATPADGTSPRTSFGDASDQDPAVEPPYSKLIWEALMSARDPDYMMPLQSIYDWFEKNTSKVKDKNKGWQNSIRHNLSMNAGFEAFKMERPGKKTINYWRLTKEAIRNGVQSTTRYRKTNHRKMMTSEHPTLSRQRSGSKGGRASRPAARMRSSNQEEQSRESSLQSPTVYPPPQSHSQPLWENHAISPAASTLPHYQPLHPSSHHHIFSDLPLPPPRDDSIQSFGMSSVRDCTTLPPSENALFYQSGEALPDHAPFGMGQLAGTDWMQGPLTNELMTGSQGPFDPQPEV